MLEQTVPATSRISSAASNRLLKIIAFSTILALAAYLRLVNLGVRGYFVPDEEISIRTGDYFVLGTSTGYGLKYNDNGSLVSLWPHPYNFEHPPLGKLLIGLSGVIFSHDSLGYRLLGAFFGIATVAVVFLIGSRFMPTPWALIASAVAAIDPILVQASRLATLDTYYIFFAVSAVFLASHIKNWQRLWASSALIGASIASKWLGVYGLVTVLALLLFSNPTITRRVSAAVSSLSTTFAIYLLSYFHYFLGGPAYLRAYSGSAPSYLLLGQHTFSDFVRLQLWMIDFARRWHVAGQYYGYVILGPLTYVLQENQNAPVFAFNIFLFLAGVQVVIAYISNMKPPLLLTIWVLAGLIPLFNQGFVWYLAFEIPAAALMISWFGSRIYERNKVFALSLLVGLFSTEVVYYLVYTPK